MWVKAFLFETETESLGSSKDFYLQSIFFVDTTAVLRNYFIKVFQWVSRMHKVLVWLASVVHVGLYLDIPDSPWSLTNSTKQK